MKDFGEFINALEARLDAMIMKLNDHLPPPVATKANKPYDKAFERALRPPSQRIGLRYTGD